MVPVGDQDDAIAFYRDKLGFAVVADVAFGDDDRWVEVAPPGGGASLALVPPRAGYETGRMTGIALETEDVSATWRTLADAGVDVDAEVMGGDGVVPPMFFMRDNNGNQLLVVQPA